MGAPPATDGVVMTKGPDPRQRNGNARRKAAKRFAAMDAPCAICHGARGPIDYSAPRNHMFPLSLAIDERAPVSRWREFGYSSREDCACDQSNWQPAHWICNAQASDKRAPVRIVREPTSGTF